MRQTWPGSCVRCSDRRCIRQDSPGPGEPPPPPPLLATPAGPDLSESSGSAVSSDGEESDIESDSSSSGSGGQDSDSESCGWSDVADEAPPPHRPPTDETARPAPGFNAETSPHKSRAGESHSVTTSHRGRVSETQQKVRGSEPVPAISTHKTQQHGIPSASKTRVPETQHSHSLNTMRESQHHARSPHKVRSSELPPPQSHVPFPPKAGAAERAPPSMQRPVGRSDGHRTSQSDWSPSKVRTRELPPPEQSERPMPPHISRTLPPPEGSPSRRARAAEKVRSGRDRLLPPPEPRRPSTDVLSSQERSRDQLSAQDQPSCIPAGSELSARPGADAPLVQDLSWQGLDRRSSEELARRSKESASQEWSRANKESRVCAEPRPRQDVPWLGRDKPTGQEFPWQSNDKCGSVEGSRGSAEKPAREHQLQRRERPRPAAVGRSPPAQDRPPRASEPQSPLPRRLSPVVSAAPPRSGEQLPSPSALLVPSKVWYWRERGPS